MTEYSTMLMKMGISRHFFSTFADVKFRGIEVARYLLYDFFNHLAVYDLDEIIRATPDIKQGLTRADMFALLDSDYQCTTKPGKKIFIDSRDFLNDVIPLLPAERLILPQGQHGPNPDALARLIGEIEARLKRCSTDYIFGNPIFHRWFLKNLPRVVSEIDQLADLFDREEISCVVTRFAYWYFWPCAPLLWLAKTRGIPSIAYQPKVMINCFNEKIANGWDGWPLADIPIVATYKTVWGPKYKEFYMSFGVPENRLPVIGNPHFDRVNSDRAISNSDFRKKYGIPDGHRVILHPTEKPDYRRLATVKMAVDAIKELPDTTLLIKTRDKEYPEERDLYNDIVQNHPRVKLVGAEHSIDDLIANSDAVLVFFTTSGIEAMFFGKPVVIVDPLHEESPYATEFGAPEVETAPELIRVLEKMFHNPDFVREVKERAAQNIPKYCLNDGKALERLVELIKHVADGEYR